LLLGRRVELAKSHKNRKITEKKQPVRRRQGLLGKSCRRELEVSARRIGAVKLGPPQQKGLHIIT